MSALDTLLKLAQRQLDEVSREAAVAHAAIQDLRSDMDAARARAQRADQAAQADIDLMIGAGDFRGRMSREQEEILERIDAEEALLETIRERLAVAYQEKSKLEQLIEREKRVAAQAAAAAEQKQLDEAAINLSNRS